MGNNDRYCSPDESLLEAFRQVAEIKRGVASARTWDDFLREEESYILSYVVNTTPKFEEDVKYYRRKKKYTNILKDLEPVIEKLKQGEFPGKVISDLKLDDGGSTYKVRAMNTNANVGQSNGYRMLYYVIKDEYEIYLLTVYSKKDGERISSKEEIVEMVRKYVFEYREEEVDENAEKDI